MRESILLFTAFSLFGCFSQKETIAPDSPPAPQKQPVQYLALGDSYTIGQSVGTKERWPEQLADSLRARNCPVKSVQIIAKTGWTTGDLNAGIDATPGMDTARNFNIVSLLIGVNNQYRGLSLVDYKKGFSDLLGRAVLFAGGRRERVFVVSIPDYAFTPFGGGNSGISAEIDQFNLANREIAGQMGIQYFDITDISRRGLDEPGLVAPDKLHPTAEQYRRWVARIVERVGEMVNE